MNAEARWLHQGFFVLGDERDNFTRAVRDELKKSLGLALKIRGFPSRQGLWQHTKWWHEGGPNYSEAQFCARISKEYPILSLGVSVEKGVEGGADAEDEMDRASWDWPRFVRDAEEILSGDIPRVSNRLGQPVSLRVHVWREGAETRAFSWLADQWYERHKGTAVSADVARFISDVDSRRASWVAAYLAQDLGPLEADQLSPRSAADILMAFDPIRRRLRGRTAG
jgi:hypothetical protein